MIFNAANILVVAAISIAGMSVAFPVGIGIALIVGVVVNYIGSEKGNPVLLFTGVILVAVAILLNARAYRRMMSARNKVSEKGIVLAVIGGVLMSLFYRFIARSMDLDNFHTPAAGKMKRLHPRGVSAFAPSLCCSHGAPSTLAPRAMAHSPRQHSLYRARVRDGPRALARGIPWLSPRPGSLRAHPRRKSG